MATKKNLDSFDEMKQTADSLLGKLEDEGKETSGAAKSFRQIVLKTMALQMRMIVWLYQYVRVMQAEQKQLDEESSLETMNQVLTAAIDSGAKLLPRDAGSSAREIKPATQTSATLPSRNGDSELREATAPVSPLATR
ncbi:MAG: hypothetical protein Q8Q95_04180 [bacterium]|nr:hypothetical protein [bacterium]